MAPPAGTIKPGRYLGIFLLIIGLLFALVFFTGDRKPSPHLGIDLKGGTTVTLTARTPNGGQPSQKSLDQARQIISQRVDGLGVSGAEVVLDGNQIVITVPGAGGDQAKTLGQTAQLGFRKVIAGPLDPTQALAQAAKADKAAAKSSKSKKKGGGGTTAGAPEAKKPTPTPPPKPDNSDNGLLDKKTQQAIAQAQKIRQSPDLMSKDTAKQNAALKAALKSLNGCKKGWVDPLRGNDDPSKPLVACDQDRPTVKKRNAYVLGPVVLDGTMVDDSSASQRTDGPGYEVDITFTSKGNSKWADLTSQMAQQSEKQGASNPAMIAFVLDTEVVSAPTVTKAIPGNTRITGDFSQQEAQDLANILKYGSLPLSFEMSNAQTVSPTLGLSSLHAGLIAGAIGFGLIVLYSLFYYRLLGVLLISSLVLTGALVYPLIILLGRYMGYTLDLAGVAGLIISIGVTADSFVVYFERIKDEIRHGRSVRSSIPRAWVRARRTIVSGDAVVLIAAVVLYILAVGQVKGFAFTIGLSTVLDLLVVFVVTHPMLVLAGNWRILNKRALSGLGMVQDLGTAAARSRKAARTAEAKGL